MPVVEKSTHIGVQKSNKNSALLTVEENIKKARRIVYNSLMGSGLHGRTGVDPETAITLFRSCVLPVLTYVLEILLPTGKALEYFESIP